MALQSARFLIKNLTHLKSASKLSKTVGYLSGITEVLQHKKSPIAKVEDITLEAVAKILTISACYWVASAGRKLQNGMKQGLSMTDSWDKAAGMELVEAARANVSVFGFTSFQEKISKAKGTAAQAVLSKLCLLYGIDQIIIYAVGPVESGFLSGEQLKLLREKKEKLLVEIRPDALGLVDAFEITDNTLNSALGNYDGRAYERLWKWANEYNDWNKQEVLDGYLENLEKIQNARKKYAMPKL